jgi:uncharacterized protein with von Willebrand factor type A (vWA) domain
MKGRLLRFITAARDGGLRISVAETLDALRAVAVVGIEREHLREALSTCLVKDEADRPLFDSLFETHFPLLGPAVRAGRRRRHAPGGGGAGRGGSAGHGDGMPSPVRTREAPGESRRREPPGDLERGDRPGDTLHQRRERREERDRALGTAEWHRKEDDARHGRLPVAQAGTRRELLRKPFRDHTALDVARSRELVALLARRLRGRLARRLRRSRRGRLDIRRTLRRAASSGGVPVHLLFRGPRPGRPDLVVLCDVSGSVSTVSEFLLGLIAPASDVFRSVETFVYVDHLCPASFENQHLVPHVPIDLHAFSDFGQVLVEYCAGPGKWLGRNTVLLVLGDARNNRRPPRARLLADVHARTRAVFWLNPEPSVRWNTGDSALAQYARHCTGVVECGNLRALVDAVGRIL